MTTTTTRQRLSYLEQLHAEGIARELALVKALWFYAHKSTYCINDANPIAAIDEDAGSVARRAISDYSGMAKFTQKEV